MFKVNSNTKIIEYRNNLKEIEELMHRGIYIDPDTGKKFFSGYEDKILFDWDQYFETILQIYMGWGSEYIKNGVLIFLDHQKESGLITRSVPVLEPDENEHVKPFLSQIIQLVIKFYGETDWITKAYYSKLKKYLDYWLENMDSNHNGLSEWMSSVHTGMDNQHERAGYWNDRFCEGVDLNCYLFLELKAFSGISKLLGEKNDSIFYLEKSYQIKKLILDKMWDEEDGFFYDIDMRTDKKIKVKSIAGFTPLWAQIATLKQAKRIIYDHMFNPKEFWSPFPICTLAKNEPGYSETQLPNDIGCNWRANTWIPTNYMIYHGLKFYGYPQLASLISYYTKKLVDESGNREYYSSETGLGKKQDPFWGWSLLAHFMPLEEIFEIDIVDYGRNK